MASAKTRPKSDLQKCGSPLLRIAPLRTHSFLHKISRLFRAYVLSNAIQGETNSMSHSRRPSYFTVIAETFTLMLNTPLVDPESSTRPADILLQELPITRTRGSSESTSVRSGLSTPRGSVDSLYSSSSSGSGFSTKS
ncbi:hypothetical protein BDQ12DRAFT_679854 [Crucibulum laeve]|uniref:Uncharacterized protein n=1 Tax=Crucibulum laeve TaxID=68775 RepID=A0A5C3M5I3_9AGAR|nr:hypothetical protein BDQ12DRAFT_679854 [Crucibulum laeve]